jgi:hypothetical protein
MTTYNSNLVSVGQNIPSVYPGTVRPVYGSVSIPSNTTLATTDTIVLFSMPGPASHIEGFWIDLPDLENSTTTLTLNLVDSETTANTIVSASTAGQAGGFISTVNAAHGKIGNGVTYAASSALKLVPNTAAGSTNGATAQVIYFGFNIAMD